METKKGYFIVLDGGDGSGKTTLLERAAEYYGNEVVFTREPGGSPYAEEIRNLIVDSSNAKQADAETMFALFWASRADHLKNTIIPALSSGKIVISSRFDSSTYAYQNVAQGAGHLKKLFWVVRDHFLGEYKPDVYVYLDLDSKIGLARKKVQVGKKMDHFEKRNIEFHEALRLGYKEFFANKDHDIKSVIIDATKSKDEVWEVFMGILPL
jgi:dTMP kinase